MKVNISKLSDFIDKRYRGNLTFFAKEAEIERSYFNQMMNGKVNNKSPKICNQIIRYCEKNNLDYKEFIFLQ